MGIRLAIGSPARSCGGRALGTELVRLCSRLRSPSSTESSVQLRSACSSSRFEYVNKRRRFVFKTLVIIGGNFRTTKFTVTLFRDSSYFKRQ
jgi:hypothetical protein